MRNESPLAVAVSQSSVYPPLCSASFRADGSAGIQRKALRLLGTFSADVRMTKALKLLGTDMQELETARNVALAALGAQRLDLANE